MATKNDYIQIDKFLNVIDNDLTDFVENRLERFILISYLENVYEFKKGLDTVHDSIKKVREIIPYVSAERYDLEKHYHLDKNLMDDNLRKEEQIDNDDFGSKLAEHGLTGYELRRKLRIFYHIRDLFLKQYGKAAKNIAQGFARRFLDAMNVILDSLANVFPPLGAVEEFKNSIEVVI